MGSTLRWDPSSIQISWKSLQMFLCYPADKPNKMVKISLIGQKNYKPLFIAIPTPILIFCIINEVPSKTLYKHDFIIALILENTVGTAFTIH